MTLRPIVFTALVICSALARAADLPLPEVIEFNRDVRPILSENCYACHGPDKNKREAELRLDTQEGLLGTDGEPGTVIPKASAKSKLFVRITSKDPDEMMPPPADGGKRLTSRDVAVLQRWIEQGAKWQGHWAYLKPAKPQPPSIEEPGFVRSDVDRFVLARLKTAGLKHAAEADRITLIRRLSLDLIGLPPKPEEVEAFVNDHRPDAYERLVERLLASPHFGERMAIYWLDLVRFADTIGYHSDNPRDIAPYRDYVVDAFNQNMPFDRFTIEQLAGDLLSSPTLEQKVASGYNRLLQTTEEGGAQAKEYEAKNSSDRVRNVASVWLGATMGCCECHDHKFDPYTTRDFYALAAYFADVKEAAIGKREPGMLVPDKKQAEEIARLEALVAADKQRLATTTPEIAAAQNEWEEKIRALPRIEWQTLEPVKATATGATKLAIGKDQAISAGGKAPNTDVYTIELRTKLAKITALRIEALADKTQPQSGPGRQKDGKFVITEVTLQVPGATKTDKAKDVALKVADASPGTSGIERTIDGDKAGAKAGWTSSHAGTTVQAVYAVNLDVGPGENRLIVTLKQQAGGAQTLGRFRLSATDAPEPVKLSDRDELPLEVDPALATTKKEAITAYYRSITPLLASARTDLARHEKNLADLSALVPRSLISTAAMPRTVRVLARGNWLDDSGEIMQPAIPAFLGKLDASGRSTRLDLARWLVSADNPLVARVFVNRLWKLFFGQGLSKSLEDLGSQGEWPTHPELLDWLAVDFRASGWDIKQMVRLLVTSGTYRQSSNLSRQARAADPYNRFLSAQGRFRLDAEIIRDNALAISGLLSLRIDGESDKPYQPEGYWDYLNFPKRTYMADQGERQYRRGLYTHWQRSFLHPSLLAFDAPSREECTAERTRSCTPQQALVLLNDPTYVEAARVFAEKIIREGGSNPDERVRWAYRRAIARDPQADEIQILTSLLAKHRSAYAKDPASAARLATVGTAPASAGLDQAELAAWVSVARAILNLHETITRL